MSEEPLPPQRLLDSDGPAADCIRRGLAEDELTVPSFARLREKRLFRLRVQRAGGALALAAAAAAFVLVPGLRSDATRPSISAEQATQAPPRLPPSPQAPVDVAEQRPAPSKPTAPSSPANTQRSRKTTATSAHNEPEIVPARTASATPDPAVAAPSAAGRSAKACAELARSSDPAEALGCYQQLAGGSGMGAELALFEQARLEGKVLRQPARALATLEDYRRRFPDGSLRAEVMLAQIEWLVAAGDKTRARALVDEALASGLLRERARELERLRSTLAAEDLR